VSHLFVAILIPALVSPALSRSAFAAEADDAQAVPAAPAGAPAAVALAAVRVEGSIDPPGRIEALLESVAPIGKPFVPAGDADRVGMPIGTIPRIKHILAVVGYTAEIGEAPTAGGVGLHLRLRAFDRVRRIFVSGNQPFLRQGIRQEAIIGKLSFRAGQKLPPAGPRREAFLTTETDHVQEFLRSSGYWEAEVRFELHDNGKVPAEVNLLIKVKLGPAYPLGPLAIDGATALPVGSIEDVFRHRDWHTLWILHQPFRRTDLRQDVTNLVQRYRGIGFPGVRVQDDFDPDKSLDRQAKNVRLGIEIKERKHVEVAFESNRTRSADTLQKVLTLAPHGAYDDVEAAASAAALERSYHEAGHMLVRVTWRRVRLSEQSDRLVFVVDEGPMLKVRGVSFVGNRALSADTLAEQVRTKVYPMLGALGLGQGGFASLRQLELDVASLTEHYAGAGYPETQVRVEIAPRPGQWRPLPKKIDQAEEAIWRNAKSLFVRFLIEESPLLWVAEMQFACTVPGEALPREDEFFTDSLRTTLGAPYQPALIKRDENRIKRALGDLGYTYAQVEAKSERYGSQMKIVWQVKLGPLVRVGPVFLRGNFLTTDGTIMTWAELRTGDVLTTHRLERAQRNLALIQLFNNPNPLSFPSATPEQAVVPMVIEVEERHDHLGVLRVGLGASTDQAPPNSSFPHLGVYGALGYEHRNLFGHGWTLMSSVAYGSTLKNYTASFLNPRFMGSLFRMQIVGTYQQLATLRLGDIHSGSGSFGFSREMYPGVDATVQYNLRNTSRTELLERGAEPGPLQGPEQNTVRIGTFVSSLSAAVEWRRLDHLLVPSKGFKVVAGVEVALPALAFNTGQDAFVKLYGRGLSVVPLLPWLSLRYSLRYDQGVPMGGAALLPKVERYYAGGDTSIRGYQLDYALTETIARPTAPGVDYIMYRPMGGNLRILQNIDLQFPTFGSLFYAAFFLDSGMVGYSWGGISVHDFRHGVGFSPLLVKLPVGDLSLSFAIPLNRHPGDDRWRTHFNVGLMF
jgi:outer membrane protein insertion porin family